MEYEQELKIGFKVQEYRKLKVRWCKLGKMFGENEAVLKRCWALYKQHLNNGNKSFLKENK